MSEEETFCIYCQRQFASPKNLRRHIERLHVDTYVYQRINLEHKKEVTP